MKLAIEATSSPLSIAIKKDGQVTQIFVDNPGTLSQALSSLLANQDLSVSDIQDISVGIGPGSFTAIRQAIGFACGLALASKIPLTAVHSASAALIAQLDNSVYHWQASATKAYALQANEALATIIMTPCLSDNSQDSHGVKNLTKDLFMANQLWVQQPWKVKGLGDEFAVSWKLSDPASAQFIEGLEKLHDYIYVEDTSRWVPWIDQRSTLRSKKTTL